MPFCWSSIPSGRILSVCSFALVVFSRSAPECRALQPQMQPRRVAIVTGATRGIGKGIAVELGREGFTVYALGRSSRERNIQPSAVLPNGVDLSVEKTAEDIVAAGGEGHAVCCDVGNDAELSGIVKGIVEKEGRLDVLVCSAYTVPEEKLKNDFWKHGTEAGGNFMAMWDAVNGVGLRSVYATCALGVPCMIETAELLRGRDSPPPLVCLVSSFGGKAYTFNVPYGVGKAAIDRLAKDMSIQLSKHNVATTAIYPGLVRTEQNMELLERGTWDEISGGGLDLNAFGETTAFTGRAVAALTRLGGEEMMKRSGNVEVVAELAEEFGFTDLDGSTPVSIRSLQYLLPNFVFPQIEEESGKPVPTWMKDNVPNFKLPWSTFSGGPPPEKE